MRKLEGYVAVGIEEPTSRLSFQWKKSKGIARYLLNQKGVGGNEGVGKSALS